MSAADKLRRFFDYKRQTMTDECFKIFVHKVYLAIKSEGGQEGREILSALGVL